MYPAISCLKFLTYRLCFWVGLLAIQYSPKATAVGTNWIQINAVLGPSGHLVWADWTNCRRDWL